MRKDSANREDRLSVKSGANFAGGMGTPEIEDWFVTPDIFFRNGAVFS